MDISLFNYPLPNRKLHWISALDADYGAISALNELQSQMKSFYSNSSTYYEDISFGGCCWADISSKLHQDILNEASKRDSILEIGCGAASILTNSRIAHKCYTGVDFSEPLIDANRQRFPDANFVHLTDPVKLPFQDNAFDMAFSIYVIEHAVFPQRFLLEKARVLRKGGKFYLLCPNFLGIGRMNSQRKGFSNGTGTEKLKKGKWFDAFVSSFDARLRIPFLSMFYRRRALVKPQFFVNLQPTCFVDPFLPDVDAIYLTFEPEMKSYLKDYIEWHPLEKELANYCKLNNLVYMKGTKK
jgi:ubiquinone/menaquinone biosynthesis C-methylase UbiE